MSDTETSSHLLVPASMMPMPPQVRLIVGHHHQVKGAGGNGHFTPGADVILARRMRLHRGDGHPEKIAHARTAMIATRAMTMAAMSATLFS